MWYGATAQTIEARGGPIARALCAAAPWPAVAMDVQRVRLSPGEYAVCPAARPLHDPRWIATGPGDPVWLAVRAAHPVLTLDGRPAPHDGAPFSAPASAVAAGLPWPDDAEPGEAIIALARRAAPGEALDRARRCGRAFSAPPGPPVDTLPDWAAERPLRFRSGYRVMAHLDGFGPEDIAAEPIMKASHPTWLAEHGGPIARAFVKCLPDDWTTPDADVIVNAKIDEFDPGWWSCLAGWHIDGTSRIPNRRSDGSPDLLEPGRTIEQIGCCLGPAGATGFLVGAIDLPVTPIGADGRGVWQRIFEDALAEGRIKAVRAPIATVVGFDFGDFHTCRPAERPGWRYFIKAMRGRRDPPQNAFADGGRITWPLPLPGVDPAEAAWPDTPLGVFPPTLPFFER